MTKKYTICKPIKGRDPFDGILPEDTWVDGGTSYEKVLKPTI